MAAKKTALAAMTVSALVIGTAACGNDSGGLGDLDAQEIADKAQAAMLDLESVTMDAQIEAADGNLEFLISMSTDGDCTGTMSMAGAKMEMLSTGDSSYMKADDTFWDEQGMDGAARNKLINDRWLVAPAGQGFDAACDLNQFLGRLDEDSDEDIDWKLTDGEKINGTSTVAISTEDDGTTTVYVADNADKPYIIKIVNEDGDGPGSVTFSDFDKPVKVKAPDEADTVSFEDIQG